MGLCLSLTALACTLRGLDNIHLFFSVVFVKKLHYVCFLVVLNLVFPNSICRGKNNRGSAAKRRWLPSLSFVSKFFAPSIWIFACWLSNIIVICCKNNLLFASRNWDGGSVFFVCYYHYYYDYVCYQYHYHWISKWMFVCQQEFRYRLRNATSLTPGLLCSSIIKQTNIQNKNQRKINKETNDSAILTEVRLYLYSLIKGGRREEGEEAGLLLVVVVVGPRAGRSIPRHGPRPPTIPSSPPPPLPTPPPSPPLPISPIQPTPLT